MARRAATHNQTRRRTIRKAQTQTNTRDEARDATDTQQHLPLKEQPPNENDKIAALITQCASDADQQDEHPQLSNASSDPLFDAPSSDAESGAHRDSCKLTIRDVAMHHTQLAHVYNSQIVVESNHAYSTHMRSRPHTLVEDYHRFDTTAANLDETLVQINFGVAIAVSAFPAQHPPSFLMKVELEVKRAVQMCREECANEGGSSSLAPVSSTILSDDAATAGRASPDAPSSAVAPAAPSQTEAADKYDRLSHTACGQVGFSKERIDQIRLADAKRNGSWFVRFSAGAPREPGTDGGKGVSDEGQRAHTAGAA